MSSVPAVPRTVRSAPRGRRQVRLAADDLAEIIELALASPGPSTVAVLEQIAGHDGDGASEVIARILARTRPTRVALPPVVAHAAASESRERCPRARDP